MKLEVSYIYKSNSSDCHLIAREDSKILTFHVRRLARGQGLYMHDIDSL